MGIYYFVMGMYYFVTGMYYFVMGMYYFVMEKYYFAMGEYYFLWGETINLRISKHYVNTIVYFKHATILFIFLLHATRLGRKV